MIRALAIALVLVASSARAETPDGGLDYGALVDVPLTVYRADGGPVDGTCLTARRAAFNAAWCAQEHEDHLQFKALYEEKPKGFDASTVAIVAGVAAVLGFVGGAYLTVKALK